MLCENSLQTSPDVVKKNNSKINYTQGPGQLLRAPENLFTEALPSQTNCWGGCMHVRVGAGVKV